MDISQWNDRAFETINEFSIIASVLESDLRAQLEKVGLVFLKQLPNPYLSSILPLLSLIRHRLLLKRLMRLENKAFMTVFTPSVIISCL